MKLTAQSMAIETFSQMLRVLSRLLDKGAEHARAKGFDPSVLVDGRLAPDMYPLVRQVEIACRQATECVARLIGEDPPASDSAGATLDALKAHVAGTIAYLESTPADAFEGGEDRAITFPLQETGMRFEATGDQYLRDWALPNFYFHVVTAYDILRNHGVELSKRDFMSHVARHIRTGAAQT